ncbi:MAG: hypothetical protein HOV78_13275 [Hamadaea sp.]|nr:hypothetical protein [Hamadaea sp.]NUT02957.1 hypothetical protein [Hamadaea sp.]
MTRQRTDSTGSDRTAELAMWELRRSIAVALAATAAGLSALLIGALWFGGFPSLKRDGTITVSTLFEVLKLIFAIVAGVGGVFALVVAYRKQRVAEHAHRLAEADAVRSDVRLFNERFSAAGDQLGSEQAAVRLAGLYSLAGLADDWPQGRQTCIDVLCAYVRLPSPDVTAEHDSPGRQELQVRASAFDIIARRLRPGAETSWQGHRFDFSRSRVRDGDFTGIHVTGETVLLFTECAFSGDRLTFQDMVLDGGIIDFADSAFDHGMLTFANAHLKLGTLDFRRCGFSGGTLALVAATFDGADVIFDGSGMRDGVITFGGTTDEEGQRALRGSVFAAGRVSLRRFGGRGGQIRFDDTAFSGGLVDLSDSVFDGTEVFLNDAREWRRPPVYTHDVYRNPGFHLPPQSRRSTSRAD